MEAHGEVGGSSNGNGKDVAGGSGMTTGHDASQSAPIPGPGYIFTGKITDPWSHAAHYGRQGFSCHYCGLKRLGGGSTRLKEHLGGLGGSVVECYNVPSEVQAAMRKNRLVYKQKKSKVQARKLRLELELLEEMGGSPVIDLDPASDEEDRVRLEREKSLRGIKLRNAVESMGSMGSRFDVGSGSGSANVESSPMTPANGKITQYLQRKSSLSPADGGTGTPASGKKGRQPRIDFSNQKLNAAKLGQAWAKWFHANDIPGWKINCPLFRSALKLSQELHAVKHLPTAYEVDGIYRNSRSESEPLLDEGGSPSQFVHDIVRDVCSKRKTVKVSSLVRRKRVKKGKMAVLDEEGEASESEDDEEEDQENSDEYVPMDVLGERWVAPESLWEFIIARPAKFSTLLAWIKRDPFESHLSHLSILRIFVRDVRQEDLEILARLPALRRLSLRQEDPEIQRQLVVSDYGFRCLTSFELFTEFLGHIVFKQGALPKAKQVRFSIGLRDAKEPAAGNGGVCFDLGLGNLRSLQEVLVAAIRWGEDTKQVEDALEDALMHAFKEHPNRPSHQLITVPDMKRLLESLPAAIPNYGRMSERWSMAGGLMSDG